MAVFRWATAGGETEIRFLNLSVATLSRYYPDSKFVVMFNGNDFDDFRKHADKMPDVTVELRYVNQRDINAPFEFETQRTWWKWHPMFVDDEYPQITVDTDIVFLKNPAPITDWIHGKTDVMAIRDQYYHRQTSCGSFGKQLQDDKLINTGIIGFRKHMPIIESMLKRSANSAYRSKKSIYQPQDEQGCFNYALQQMEQRKYIAVAKLHHHHVCWWPHYKSMEFAIHFIGFNKAALSRHYDQFRDLLLADKLDRQALREICNLQ